MAAGRTPVPVRRALTRMGQDFGTWRKLQELTVEQTADRAGVSRQTVLRVERGEGASLENVLRIARALGVIDQLAGSIDPYDTDVGRLRADGALPQRVRGRRPS